MRLARRDLLQRAATFDYWQIYRIKANLQTITHLLYDTTGTGAYTKIILTKSGTYGTHARAPWEWRRGRAVVVGLCNNRKGGCRLTSSPSAGREFR